MRLYSEQEARDMLASKIEKAGSQRAFAMEHNINAGYLGRVVAGAALSPAILSALGLEVASTVTTYRRMRR